MMFLFNIYNIYGKFIYICFFLTLYPFFPVQHIFNIYLLTFIYFLFIYHEKLVTLSILIPENVLAQESNWNGKNQRRTVMQ